MRFPAHRHFRLFLTCMTAAAVLLEITESYARMGGGHSYSGRSDSHGFGGGGGGGGGDLFGLILWLLFRNPAVGITVLVIGGGVIGLACAHCLALYNWAISVSREPISAAPPRHWLS